MKRFLSIALLASIGVLTTSTTMAANPDIVAHRGGALLWPENSIYALQRAEQMGVEILELDLQLTEDNQLLVTHDSDINPQFCKPELGKGLVAKPVRVLSLAQSKQFECGLASRAIYPNAEKRPGIRMPALEEVFQAFASNNKIRYFIETKVPKAGSWGAPIDTTLYAAKLDQLIRKYGLQERVIVQSFDWRTLKAMRELNAAVRTCPLAVPRNSSDYVATLAELGATCIVLAANETTPAQVKSLQKSGVAVFSGVIDAAEDWQQALDLGYDAIFTNDPAGLDRFLREKGARTRRQ